MSTVSRFQPVSAQDYLLGERTARHKHEYVDGVVYAMAGGIVQHSRIASNITGSLYSQLRGHKCQVFNSDAVIPLPEIQCELALKELYQNVEFAAVIRDEELQ